MPYVSESRPKLKTKNLLFSLRQWRRWRRRRGCDSILSGVPDSSWAPSSSRQRCLGRPTLHCWLRTQDQTRKLAETSQFTAHTHMGDGISVEMCVYIPQNTLKHRRNWNLKNQNFDPTRIRALVSGQLTRISHTLTAWHEGVEYDSNVWK